MSFCDAQMSDVAVILDKRWESRLADATEQLKHQGMSISSADDDKGVVEGTVESQKIPEIQKLDCVDYVRVIFTWVADYPVGDPRDKDNVAREYDTDEV